MKSKLKRLTAVTMLFVTSAPVAISTLGSTSVFADDELTPKKEEKESKGQREATLSFIKSIKERAVEIANDFGLYPSVMIAQAVLESDSGESQLSQAPYYNLFAFKGAYDGKSVELLTSELTAEGGFSASAEFRLYSSSEESLRDYAKLLSQEYYSGVWRENTKDYKDATLSLEKKYSSSEDYSTLLNEIIEEFDLTKYDKKSKTKKEKLPFLLRREEVRKDRHYQTGEHDSLWGIAREFKVNLDNLVKWNPTLTDLDTSDLPSGLNLKVGEDVTDQEVAYLKEKKVKDITHRVKKADSVWSIGNKYGLTVSEVRELNPDLPSDNVLYLDDKIKVGEEVSYSEKILSPQEQEDLIKREEEKREEKRREKAELKRLEEERKELEEELRLLEEANSNGVVVKGTTSPKESRRSSESMTVAGQVIEEARKYIGTPYVWGGRQPGGFDCSGLMQYVFKQVTGSDIGAWTVPQESAGETIAVSEAQPGDLYFWGSHGGTTHVALAIGNGDYIHAPQPGENVKIGKVKWFAPSFAVRVLK